ncbi:hypothetical protein E2C01_001746 [Portunus trituberculatus]|uniref:Uncharacterized protein n=1 Tax=Portunus trituberculatus TaxID=210409 RepID=A0A5B7CN98_PORTR|nr:hypothetical protein [Portunus trituberculatus]
MDTCLGSRDLLATVAAVVGCDTAVSITTTITTVNTAPLRTMLYACVYVCCSPPLRAVSHTMAVPRRCTVLLLMWLSSVAPE